MPGLGRAALVVALGLVLYAVAAGGYAAVTGRRRVGDSARNALVASFVACLAAAVVLLGAFLTDDLSFAYVADHSSRDLPARYAFTALWSGQEGSLLFWVTILTGMGSAAVFLNRRLVADVLPWTVPDHRGGRRLLRDRARVRVESVHDRGRAGGRRRPEPESPEPVHDGAPPDALPRLRGAHHPVCVRDGGARLETNGRALDHRDTPLDAPVLDVPRHRHPARIEVGVRGGRVGRLVRVGSRRECGADAVARGDGVPALGDGAGEEEHAPGVEHRARRARVRALRLRHVPHPKRRASTRSTASRSRRSARGSSASSASSRSSRSR